MPMVRCLLLLLLWDCGIADAFFLMFSHAGVSHCLTVRQYASRKIASWESSRYGTPVVDVRDLSAVSEVCPRRLDTARNTNQWVLARF